MLCRVGVRLFFFAVARLRVIHTLSSCSYMRPGRAAVLGGSNVRKATRHGAGLLALLLLQVQASCFLLPTSPASASPNRLRQHHRLPRLPKLPPSSFAPATQQQQLAAAKKGQRRVITPLSSVQRSAAVGGMGASPSRSGASSPQQTSMLIGDGRRGGGGGYGAAASDTRLGAAASGVTDPEDPGTGETAHLLEET